MNPATPRHARCIRLLFALTLGMAFAGCAGSSLPGLVRAPNPERDAWDRAQAEVERDPEAGYDALSAYVVSHPRHSRADDGAYQLAQIDLQRGRPEEAARWLRWILLNHGAGDRVDAARLQLGAILLDAGDLEAAWRAAKRARISLLEGQERRSGLRLMAELAEARGDIPEQLIWLSRSRASASNEDDAAAIDGEVDAVLAALPRNDVESVASRLGRRSPAARAWLRAAELSLMRGDRDSADRALRRARSLPLSPQEVQRLAALEAGHVDPSAIAPTAPDGLAYPRLPDFADAGSLELPPGALTGTLGVVLPLSGPLAAVAEETLQGILLATGVFGGRQSGVRLLVRDSGGNPERAAAAIRELSQREEVVAVVGPLLAEEARAAADAAEAAQIVLLALTRHEDVARDRPHVLRFGLTRRTEVEMLVEHAVHDLGLMRIAILHPADSYGQEFADLMRDVLEQRGGVVVDVASYEPDATDFAGPIRSLVGYDEMSSGARARVAQRKAMLDRAKRMAPGAARELREEAAELRAPGGGPLPPIIDFDALFIPESHDKVVLIAPQLAFHDVRGVTLLGTSGWHHADLVRIAGRHVEGAVFPSPFDAEDPSPLVHRFVEQYERSYGKPPGVFAAQGFDAANLALFGLARGSGDSESLLRELLGGPAYVGVSGVVAFEPDGNARRRPLLLTIRGGRTTAAETDGTERLESASPTP